ECFNIQVQYALPDIYTGIPVTNPPTPYTSVSYPCIVLLLLYDGGNVINLTLFRITVKIAGFISTP
ncbi:MAG: hypothetical protein ACRCYD_13415, partial [Plesiomonas sp.]